MAHPACSRHSLSLFIRQTFQVCYPRRTLSPRATPNARRNFSAATIRHLQRCASQQAFAKDAPRRESAQYPYIPFEKTPDSPIPAAPPNTRSTAFPPPRPQPVVSIRKRTNPQVAAPVSTPAPKPPQPHRSPQNEHEGVEPEADAPPKRPEWQIQKAALRAKFGGAAWNPPKKLSPDTLDGIRYLHKQYPQQFTTPALAKHFEISPEAVRRILKSKWQPTPEEEEERRLRWERRGERAWTTLAEEKLMRPPKKWREKGIGTDVPRRPTVAQWAELEVKKLMDRRREQRRLKEAAAAKSSSGAEVEKRKGRFVKRGDGVVKQGGVAARPRAGGVEKRSDRSSAALSRAKRKRKAEVKAKADARAAARLRAVA